MTSGSDRAARPSQGGTVTCMSVDLDARGRRDRLRQAAAQVADVVVIGGGIVGAGTALDCASRGLSTVLIEAGDWACGTSSRSSRLIHGGVRYLEQGDIRLVTEALTERGHLLADTAPHLVQPVAFAYPLTGPWWERGYVGAGLSLYDALSRVRIRSGHLPPTSHLTRSQLSRISPSIDPGSHHGAVCYRDGFTDDARLVLAVVRTAAAHGATCIRQLRADGITRDSSGLLTITASDPSPDPSSSTPVELRARHVVLACGPATAHAASQLGIQAPAVTASKGVHLLVRRDRIASATGVITRTDRSVLFLIPAGRHWIIGTTDTAADPADPPIATADDLAWILQQANRILTDPLTAHDVVSAYAGYRPLVADPDNVDTAAVSREHALTSGDGVTAVAGGKYTTYRSMAADVADHVVDSLAGPGTHRSRPSRTAHLRLAGATSAQKPDAAALARQYRLEPATVQHLLARHGDQVPAMLATSTADDRDLLDSGTDYLRLEVRHAARAEDCGTLIDLLTRRMHLMLETADHGRAAAREAVQILAREHGWSDGRCTDELAAYDALVAREQAGVAALRRRFPQYAPL